MRFDRTDTADELHARYADLAPDTRTGNQTSVAGRVTSIRGHGKLEFVTLQDVSGSIQLLMSASLLDSPAMEVRDRLDLGDWLGAAGEVVTSRRGELSVDVTSLTPLSKALRPLPDKWHGLSDEDMRYRQREVDLLANPDSRRVFDVRFKTLASMRQTFTDEGFVEVETPILQSLAGGAIARPFVTHSNALDIDLSLRIAPELFLKRLVVGGYERVFEIARNFRNEGIDTRHSPEFTLLEAYRAFGDVHDGLDLTERAIVTAAAAAVGSPHLHGGRSQGGPHAALAPPRAARPVGGGGGPTAAPERPGGGGACRVRRARRALPGVVGLGQAHLRDVRQDPPAPACSTRSSSAASRSRSARWPATGPTTPPWPTASSS